MINLSMDTSTERLQLLATVSAALGIFLSDAATAVAVLGILGALMAHRDLVGLVSAPQPARTNLLASLRKPPARSLLDTKPLPRQPNKAPFRHLPRSTWCSLPFHLRRTSSGSSPGTPTSCRSCWPCSCWPSSAAGCGLAMTFGPAPSLLVSADVQLLPLRLRCVLQRGG